MHEMAILERTFDHNDLRTLVNEHGPVVVPVARRLSADLLTPVAAFLALRRGGRYNFLLESVEGGEKIARYSFLGRNPYLILQTRQDGVVMRRNEGAPEEAMQSDIFEALRHFVGKYTEIRLPHLPRFTGGAVGYCGYDAVRYLEKLPDRLEDDIRLPVATWCFYDTVVAFDHVKHQILVISNLFLKEATDIEDQQARAQQRIQTVIDDLQTRDLLLPEMIQMDGNGMRSNFEREDFLEAVQTAKDLIRDGDIFQVVLSQRFSEEFVGDPFNMYRALRQVNHSPYLFFLDYTDFSIVGSSPELLVRVENGRAETLPIAGTRPRGSSPEQDAEFEAELLADPKERAEHVMLVDLGRNDLSRVCEEGSVNVDGFAYVERFSHVMHIVSSVSGRLAAGCDAIDALKACFPAGTVSGAPKVRAMEIIEQLEPGRRGIYAGAVGYLDFSGNLDTCIAIRTMVIHGGQVHVQAGAGIVADSDPAAEFEETRNKAMALDHAIRMAAQNLL
jgi:anthranilate synthase component 1